MNRGIKIVSVRNSIIAWIVICANSSKYSLNAFAMFFLSLHISPFIKTPSGELLCGFLCSALSVVCHVFLPLPLCLINWPEK